MVLGYDQERPKAEDYKRFLADFVRSLERLGNTGISLMLFGSYVREDYVPGISDIDAVLIFPDKVVIDKSLLGEVSLILRGALEERYVPFQVTVTDLTTMADGRFNTFNPSFKIYFQQERRIVVGPDYRNRFRFLMPKIPDQSELTRNLRKVRQRLLFAEYNREYRPEILAEDIDETLKDVSSGSKQILFMVDSKLRVRRFSALEDLPKVFQEVSTKPLEHMKHLYTHHDELGALYFDTNQGIEFCNSAVTFLEELVLAYINKVPNQG